MAQITRIGLPTFLRGLAPMKGALSLMAGLVVCPMAAWAGPVQCTTSLEAPILPAAPAGSGVPPAPVEVTRCSPLETVPQLMERRAYTWTAPFQQGVDIAHQLSGIFGISLAGASGERIMGFGFPDQTLIWDASAISNTTAALMDQQVHPMPQRTQDLASVFTTSLAADGLAAPGGSQSRSARIPGSAYARNVRGLW